MGTSFRALGETRTRNLRLRRPTLYPIPLRARQWDRKESNLHSWFRRPVLYPLSYGPVHFNSAPAGNRNPTAPLPRECTTVVLQGLGRGEQPRVPILHGGLPSAVLAAHREPLLRSIGAGTTGRAYLLIVSSLTPLLAAVEDRGVEPRFSDCETKKGPVTSPVIAQCLPGESNPAICRFRATQSPRLLRRLGGSDRSRTGDLRLDRATGTPPPLRNHIGVRDGS